MFGVVCWSVKRINNIYFPAYFYEIDVLDD